MSVRTWSWVVALSLSCAAACGGGGVPVQSPTTLSAGRSVGQTEQAILDALPKRGWTAESVQPGRIIAFLAVRSHLLRVEIRYDQQQVGIYYVDSDQLSAHVAANGQVYAHNKVNAWIRNLAQDISAALAVAPQPGTAGSAINAPNAPNAPNTPPPGAPMQAAPVQQ